MQSPTINKYIPASIRAKIVFWWRIFMFLISATVISAMVIDYGFVLDQHETDIINEIYGVAWWVYFISYTLELILYRYTINKKRFALTLAMGIVLFLMFISKIRTVDPSGGLHWLWMVLENSYFQIGVIGLFAIMEISKGVVSFINKKTNPAMLMVVGFAFIILFGALLLMVPRSTIDGYRIPVVDALFTSTSAVCVTGLTSVDVSTYFTLEGQIIILLLIQIGGLGVMTITSFFALFFMGSTGLYSQFALKDMVSSNTFSSLISTLLHVIGFTLIIELGGAMLIWFDIHSTLGMNLSQEIFFSIFHSVSAFCNAGFSTLPNNLGNEALMTGHNGFYLIISALIVLGGIGFPILVNLKKTIGYYISTTINRYILKRKEVKRFRHLTSINTKMVLYTTLFLIAGGTFGIAIAEWNGAFAYMDNESKIVHSLFNAIVPRTAGFNSVSLTEFSFLSIMVYFILMWIGGASQSTAGGIKVNTAAVMLANMKATIKGRRDVTMFNREISPESIRRASAIMFGSIIIILVFFTTLVILEPELSPKALLFETISAFSTVGSSINITPFLGEDSKLAVIVLMFMGRVGFITVLMCFTKHNQTVKHKFPKEDVIIN